MLKRVLAVIAALAMPVAAGFSNGGFEAGPADFGLYYNVDSAANPNDITGWTVTQGNVDIIGTYWQAGEGSRSLDLSGGTIGAIAQTFDTIANGVYMVNFLLSGNPAGDPQLKTLTVSAGSFSQNYSYDSALASLTNMNWAPQGFYFVADSTSTTLTFTSLVSGAYGPALDGVSVLYVAPVPEPATWAMLIAGFGGIGATLRRRARPVVAHA